ncbi:type VII secretion system-associated protein [Streptomyces sp. NPDC005573]|uniref:type VII secretion system-associated protein n=1 Tax=Streptomyces sp. NPDC005573 TaxID=3156890 RepID=UPI0033BB1A9A
MSGTSGKSGSSRESDEPAAEAATRSPDRPAEAGTEEVTGQVPSDAEGMPPVPEHIREAARQAPDHWFGMIDPTWSGEGAPPDWAMVGQWRSNLEGEIVEWRDNEEYRPSPKALEWPDPTDPVDAAVQLAATGYGSAEDVTRALATAEVAVFLAPGGGLLSAVAPDDQTPIVPVFTAPDHLHAAGRLSFKPLRIRDLLDQLPEDHLIYLNASGPVSMTVEPQVLRESLTAAARTDDENAWIGDLDDILPTGSETGTPTGGATDPDTKEPS